MPCFRFGLLTLLLGFGWPNPGQAEPPTYSWTVLVPENDSRAGDVRAFDELLSKTTVDDMNQTEEVFHHRLTWQKVPISRLLSVSAPFCELDFDGVKPLILTPGEKAILQEYLDRGGFISLSQDVYPYSRAEYWSVKKWPVIDFLTRELPASDHHFSFERITEKHPLFHQFYKAKIPDFERHELQNNPSSPDFILVSYRGRPCVFVDGTYVCDDDKWITFPRPFNINLLERPFTAGVDNGLYVNLYIYATMH